MLSSGGSCAHLSLPCLSWRKRVQYPLGLVPRWLSVPVLCLCLVFRVCRGFHPSIPHPRGLADDAKLTEIVYGNKMKLRRPDACIRAVSPYIHPVQQRIIGQRYLWVSGIVGCAGACQRSSAVERGETARGQAQRPHTMPIALRHR